MFYLLISVRGFFVLNKVQRIVNIGAKVASEQYCRNVGSEATKVETMLLG